MYFISSIYIIPKRLSSQNPVSCNEAQPWDTPGDAFTCLRLLGNHGIHTLNSHKDCEKELSKLRESLDYGRQECPFQQERLGAKCQK